METVWVWVFENREYVNIRGRKYLIIWICEYEWYVGIEYVSYVSISSK